MDLALLVMSYNSHVFSNRKHVTSYKRHMTSCKKHMINYKEHVTQWRNWKLLVSHSKSKLKISNEKLTYVRKKI